MLTGTLKNKIDAIWQDFYNENMAQTSDIVNQLTMLMFVKMLDDKQSDMEAQAAVLGLEPAEKDLTFKKGNYRNYETVNGQKQLRFEIPYADLRWRNFKNLNTSDLAKRIKNYVVPFVQDPENKAVGAFTAYSSKYIFGFDGKERLLTAVVDKLSDPELDFTNTDLMGDVYEYMCASGISGQFRTPRHIIDMAVEMMKPRIGEKIIDPAMGTAGFLIEAAKFIQENQRQELLNVNNRRKFSSEMFYGCDNDPNMARIGYMNCVLHGIKDPAITMDSLLEHENAKDLIGQFDLVLQNPPFSGSLVESATNGRLLTITKTKKTELLFVALMLELMKVGGRGMSVVPDGVLFGSSKAHLSLRRELVDNQKLIAVISMPSGIFKPYTGVSTAMLVFSKTNAGGTDNVWFYDMKADGYSLDDKRSPIAQNDIPDIIARFNNLEAETERKRTDQSFLVPKDEIVSNGYDLSINKYKQTEYKPVEYPPTHETVEKIDELWNEMHKEIVALKQVLSTGE